MSNQFLGEIRVFPFNFPPKGWAFCDGQLMAISSNTALFSLLGTQFGGDGKTTFGLPAMQGSSAIGQGQGQGLADYSMGQAAGSPNVTLITSDMPMHTHTMKSDTGDNVNTQSPVGGLCGSSPATLMYSTAASSFVPMAGQCVTITGSSQPHNNMMPYLTLNFCIALQGIYPPRA